MVRLKEYYVCDLRGDMLSGWSDKILAKNPVDAIHQVFPDVKVIRDDYHGEIGVQARRGSYIYKIVG